MHALVIALQLLAAAAAAFAAYFWYQSSKVPVPKEFGVARYAYKKALEEENPEKTWAKTSSIANAKGAIAAAASAALTAVSLLVQVGISSQ